MNLMSETSIYFVYTCKSRANVVIKVKFHKIIHNYNSMKKLALNTMNILDLKCFSCKYQCLFVVIIIQQFLYDHFLLK